VSETITKIIDVHCGWGATTPAPNWREVDEIRKTMAARCITMVCISSLLARRYDLIGGNEALAGALKEASEADPATAAEVKGWLVIHPARSREVTEQMRRHLYSTRFIGAALYPDPLTGDPVTLGDARDLVTAVQRYGKPLLVETPNAEAMAEVVHIADAMPGLKIIASGMGGDDWREAIQMAARPGNLYLDISGALVPEKLDHAVDILHGTRRILFASGAPQTDPAAILGLLDDIDLIPKDRERILSGNAEKLFNLGVAPEQATRRALLELDAEPTFANYMIGNVEEPAPSGEQPAPQQRAGLQGLGALTEETPEGAGGT
jgi:predicted TIM-barrel fold metal-dependent hydrolase